jgi:repressor LexA
MGHLAGSLAGSYALETLDKIFGRDKYLAFIHLYTRLHRRPPAEIDMQQYFRVSPPSVHQMVLTLERAGFIRRQPRVARSIEVLVDPRQLPELL